MKHGQTPYIQPSKFGEHPMYPICSPRKESLTMPQMQCVCKLQLKASIWLLARVRAMGTKLKKHGKKAQKLKNNVERPFRIPTGSVSKRWSILPLRLINEYTFKNGGSRLESAN